MSLMQRVERAQQGTDGAVDPDPGRRSAVRWATTRQAGTGRVPAPGAARPPGRGGRVVRHAARHAAGRSQRRDREAGRSGPRGQGLHRHPGRTVAVHRGHRRRRHRPGPVGNAPQRRLGHRGHGQRAEPDLHRARRQDPSGRHALPEQRACPADHRPDHHPARTPHRRLEPEGRCPPRRRLPRQRDHRAAVPGRAGHHGPQVRQEAVHGGRPDRVRNRHGRDVRIPGRLRQGQAQRLRVGRDGLGQDHDAQRHLAVHPERRTDRHDRGRRRAPASPGARHHARGTPGQPRGRGRGHDPQPAAQRDAHAPGPDHRRRVSCRRGARHAPGDDHRSRWFAVDRPRQHARRTCSVDSRR